METQTDLRFGALAVKNGFASESDVEFALETQRETAGEGVAPPVGEILREMGALTPEKINALVVEQNVLRGGVVDTPLPVEEKPPAPQAAAADTPAPPGLFRRILADLGSKLGRLFRNWIGKTEKERTQASEKRDEIIGRIAEAALGAGISGADADAARKAKEARDAARKKVETAIPGRAALAASAGAKVAETKLKMALVKLGRRLIEKGEVPPDQEPLVAEVRALEEKIADLS